MKKVGVLTYHDSDNFGSVLQAYAINEYINSLGYDCKIIDYRKLEVKKLYKIFKWPRSRYQFFMNIYNTFFYQKLKKRKKNFEKFRKVNLRLTDTIYTSADELKSTNCDIYIVGSDQVWNTNIVDFDSAYLLDFTNKRKVAYAASFGPKGCAISEIELFKKNLLPFNSIMVRERAAEQFCRSQLKLETYTVCDPVLLLSKQKWKSIERPVKGLPTNYILCYFAGGVSATLEKFSFEMSKKYGYKRILLMPDWHDWKKRGKRLYNAGPAEFIYLIRNAQIVCTNSFHGSAFSVIFNKKFVVDDSNNDERLKTLLELSKNQSSCLSVVLKDKRIEESIYSKNLTEFILRSKERLKIALEG